MNDAECVLLLGLTANFSENYWTIGQLDNWTNGLTNKHDSCLIKCAQNASLNDFSGVFARYWCERALLLGYRNVAGAGGVDQ